jgi:hypothetical protein
MKSNFLIPFIHPSLFLLIAIICSCGVFFFIIWRVYKMPWRKPLNVTTTLMEMEADIGEAARDTVRKEEDVRLVTAAASAVVLGGGGQRLVSFLLYFRPLFGVFSDAFPGPKMREPL